MANEEGNTPEDPFDPWIDDPDLAKRLPSEALEARRIARMGWHDYFGLVHASSYLDMLAGAQALNEDQLRAALIAATLAEHQDDDDPWWSGLNGPES